MATKRIQKSYDNEYKAQAVKLAQKIGGQKAEINFMLGEIRAFFMPKFRREEVTLTHGQLL